MSTPSISNSSSRSSLEDVSQSDSPEPEKQKKSARQPVQDGSAPKPPSTSNRPPQQTNVWSLGQPRTVSQPLVSGQPRVVATPRRDAPKGTPASSGAGIGSTAAPSSPVMPAVQPSSPSTSVAPAAQRKDNRVFAKDLSPKIQSSLAASLQVEGKLAPEKLGELLVAVESKGGQNKLAGDAIRSILRGALQVRDFSSPSSDGSQDVNVIKQVCEPFMFRHLVTPELEKSRKKFIGEFDKVADKFEGLAKEIPQKAWISSDRMAKLMEPAMGPVINLICGKDHSVNSSSLPQPVKDMLVSIDKHVIKWFETNGTGKPADLLEARKSAMIGFLSTRSLGYVWLTLSKSEKAIDDQHLMHLMAYMNSYVSKNITGFVMDLLLTQPDQPAEARKYIEVLTKKTVLKSKPSVPVLALGKASEAKMLSPRLPAASATPRTLGSASASSKAEEKQAKQAKMAMQLERAKLVDRLAEESGLKEIDYVCYQYVKDIVVNMSRRGFDHFKKVPTASFIKHAEKFYAKLENHQKVKEGLPEKVKNAFQALGLRMIGNPFEDDGASVASQPKRTAPSSTALDDESSATEPSDETEVETESSENEKQG